MTDLKDVTNITQCKWLLSGADPVKVETACNCQLTLRDAKRKNAAIDEINAANEADRAAREEQGRAIFNEFIELLTRYQDDYIREMNRLRKVEKIGSVCHQETDLLIVSVGGCGGATGDDCTKDCFTKNNQQDHT